MRSLALLFFLLLLPSGRTGSATTCKKSSSDGVVPSGRLHAATATSTISSDARPASDGSRNARVGDAPGSDTAAHDAAARNAGVGNAPDSDTAAHDAAARDAAAGEAGVDKTPPSDALQSPAVGDQKSGAPPSSADGKPSQKRDRKNHGPGSRRRSSEEARRKNGSCWPGPPGSDPRSCPPNDPGYSKHWEFASDIPEGVDRSRMHPREVELGSIGFSLDKAWQHTIGRDDVVIAVLDSGILWDNKDLVRKLHLNAGELPLPEGSSVYDKNGDGIFNIDDYAGDSRVPDANGNGILDPGDLILAFSDCRDDDGNGYADDICGFDFFSGEHCGVAGSDNDPGDETRFGHGTGIAIAAAAETNNGIGDAGVCPRCRVLPVRVGDSFVVDANQFARGVVFAVRGGATVIASALGSYNNTPAARAAVDFAYEHEVPVIASSADEFSYHHNFPSVYEHALAVNAIRFNHLSDFRKASTFWGVNPCTNFGARTWITVPATTCSSGATARLAGVAGLIESKARDAGVNDLRAEELYQVLRMTADDLDNSTPDWGKIFYPARAGFDQFYGYGRVNAARAVEAVEERRLPPVADLRDPGWFAIVSPEQSPTLQVTGRVEAPRGGHATYRLEYALGVEPREGEYRLVAGGNIDGVKDGRLGLLEFRSLPLPTGPPPRNREERDRYSVSLRLRVTDERGLTGEARRSFFVYQDPSLKKGFPIDLNASGEAAPVLADLDGDGRDEIILPTADGYLRILKWSADGWRTLRVPLDPRAPASPLDARTPTSTIDVRAPASALDPQPTASTLDPRAPGSPPGPLAAEHAPNAPAVGQDPSATVSHPSSAADTNGSPNLGTVIRGAAVGDLFGDGRPAIVVATREGRVHAFSASGKPLRGFPVSIPPLAHPASPAQTIESGILSSPVLTDLDGRPGLEIVVSALDGQIHAWRNDGTVLDGFPVRIEDPGEGTGADSGTRSKIVSTPAIGDIDGDGRPEIVTGSNRVRKGMGAAYAVRSDGNRHPGGAFVPGWNPFEVPAIRPELLPTLATGIPMDPILVDVDGDGDQEVILYAVTSSTIVLVDQDHTGRPRILASYSMSPGRGSELQRMSFIAGTGSPLLADVDHDGEPELYAPLLPLRMLTLRTKPGVPLDVPLALGGWNLRGWGRKAERAGRRPSVPMIPNYPRRLEDLVILAPPVAADVDGDGIDEVLLGTGGYLLHAFEKAGGEAAGFPKFTGGWIFSAPAVGDLDGDGRLDLVTVTREGYLFAWGLDSPRAAPRDR